jgi:uncharacterized iron-regulated protein
MNIPFTSTEGNSTMRLFFLFLLLAGLLLGAGCARPTGPGDPSGPEGQAAGSKAVSAEAGVRGKRSTAAAKPPKGLLNADLKSVSTDAFLRQARTADYILVGEGHADVCSQEMTAALIKDLAKAGRTPVIGLEMVSVERQSILDRFNRGEIETADLEAELNWAKTWGYPFAAYAPVFEAARAAKAPLRALNLPRDVVRRAGTMGVDNLPSEDRVLLPETIVPPPAEQEEVLEQAFAFHLEDDTPEAERQKRLERFFLVQSLWDSTMAERAVEARQEFGSPVLILAGAGHVEFGWGIGHRLAILEPGASQISIMPWRGPRVGKTGDARPEGADLYHYCPLTRKSSLGMTLVEEGGAVRVASVAPESRADFAGMEPGDVLTKAGSTDVTRLMDLHSAARDAAKAGEPLRLTVRRGSEELELELPVGQ